MKKERASSIEPSQKGLYARFQRRNAVSCYHPTLNPNACTERVIRASPEREPRYAGVGEGWVTRVGRIDPLSTWPPCQTRRRVFRVIHRAQPARFLGLLSGVCACYFRGYG